MQPILYFIRNGLLFLPSLIGLSMLWTAAWLEQESRQYAAHCIGCADYIPPSSTLIGIGLLSITLIAQIFISYNALNRPNLLATAKLCHRLWLLLYPCVLSGGLFLIYR